MIVRHKIPTADPAPGAAGLLNKVRMPLTDALVKSCRQNVAKWHIPEVPPVARDVSLLTGTRQAFPQSSKSAYDLGCVKTFEVVVGAQQRNQTCSIDESFMREQRFFRINLAFG
jgi:hypothetical protein